MEYTKIGFDKGLNTYYKGMNVNLSGFQESNFNKMVINIEGDASYEIRKTDKMNFFEISKAGTDKSKVLEFGELENIIMNTDKKSKIKEILFYDEVKFEEKDDMSLEEVLEINKTKNQLIKALSDYKKGSRAEKNLYLNQMFENLSNEFNEFLRTAKIGQKISIIAKKSKKHPEEEYIFRYLGRGKFEFKFSKDSETVSLKGLEQMITISALDTLPPSISAKFGDKRFAYQIQAIIFD